MKKIVILISMLLIFGSLPITATQIHFSLNGVNNYDHLYVCALTTDSAIVHKPDGAGYGYWLPNANPPALEGDSVIITQSSPSFWEFTDGNIHIVFYVNFVSIAPTESWTVDNVSKCSETTITLYAQTNPQEDFTYLWDTGETTLSLSVPTPGIHSAVTTGACGMVEDAIEVIDYVSPQPDLGDDQVVCDGETIVLNPGEFAGYDWTTGATTPTIEVGTTNSYGVTVTDGNGCQASDAILVEFVVNDGEEILLLTIDTISGNNRITWPINGLTDVTTVIYREESSNVYVEVGNAPYLDGGWTDQVSSVNQTWRYKIATIDTCGNESPQSAYHQSISTATVPLVPSGYRIEWTEYLIEGVKTEVVSNYYVFAVDGLGEDWVPVELAMVSGSVTNYNMPTIDDSLFFVGAALAAKDVNGLALSNVVHNPLVSSISDINNKHLFIYPNPSTGVFTVSGRGVVSMYNGIGQCILTDMIDGKKEYVLSRGIYVVKITKDMATYTQTVIIR